jgi:hypothetical protein
VGAVTGFAVGLKFTKSLSGAAIVAYVFRVEAIGLTYLVLRKFDRHTPEPDWQQVWVPWWVDTEGGEAGVNLEGLDGLGRGIQGGSGGPCDPSGGSCWHNPEHPDTPFGGGSDGGLQGTRIDLTFSIAISFAGAVY